MADGVDLVTFAGNAMDGMLVLETTGRMVAVDVIGPGLTLGLEVMASVVASVVMMPVELPALGVVASVGMVAFVGVMPVELSVELYALVAVTLKQQGMV